MTAHFCYLDNWPVLSLRSNRYVSMNQSIHQYIYIHIYIYIYQYIPTLSMGRLSECWLTFAQYKTTVTLFCVIQNMAINYTHTGHVGGPSITEGIYTDQLWFNSNICLVLVTVHYQPSVQWNHITGGFKSSQFIGRLGIRRFHLRCAIFKWVAVTWLKNRAPG